MAVLRSQGVAAVSANGVIGDPATASAETGRLLFEAMLTDLEATLTTGSGGGSGGGNAG